MLTLCSPRYQKTRCNFKLSYCPGVLVCWDRAGWREICSVFFLTEKTREISSQTTFNMAQSLKHTQFIMIKIYRSRRPEFLSILLSWARISWFSCVLSFLNKFSYSQRESSPSYRVQGWWQSNKFLLALKQSQQSFIRRDLNISISFVFSGSSFVRFSLSPSLSPQFRSATFVCSFVGLFHMGSKLIASLWSWLKRQRWRRHLYYRLYRLNHKTANNNDKNESRLTSSFEKVELWDDQESLCVGC